MDKKMKQIETKIAGIKEKLMKIGEMRPGSLTQQYKNPKEKSGGFFQISYTHKMRSRTEYVRPEFVESLETQIAEFKLFKKLVQEWTDQAITYSKLKIQHQIKKPNSK